MNNKKNIELTAVEKLLKLQGINFVEKDFDLDPDDPADIVFIPTCQKYQVTQAMGEIGKVLNTGTGEFSHNINDSFIEFVQIAIDRKLKKYGGGRAVSNVILVIYDIIEPPRFLEEVKENKKNSEINSYIKKAGFKEIYCVFNFQNTKEAIKIF